MNLDIDPSPVVKSPFFVGLLGALVAMRSAPGTSRSERCNPPVGAITSGVIKVAVSGVTAGQTYQVITRVRSAAGRVREWEFRVLGVPGGVTP